MTTFHPSPFFFEELGISEKDCAKAFKQLKQSTSLLSPMTDFRALCVELTDCLEKADWPHRYKIVFQQWTDIARAALAEPEPEGPTNAEIHALADELLDGDSASRVDFARAIAAELEGAHDDPS